MWMSIPELEAADSSYRSVLKFTISYRGRYRHLIISVILLQACGV